MDPNGIGGYGHDASYYGGNSCDGGGNEEHGVLVKERDELGRVNADLGLGGECTDIGEEGKGKGIDEKGGGGG